MALHGCAYVARRVPSECLPIVVGGEASCEEPRAEQAVLWHGVDCIILRLRRRKNMPAGSRHGHRLVRVCVAMAMAPLCTCRLVRTCWCEECCLTCPVHVLGYFFRSGGGGGSHALGHGRLRVHRSLPAGSQPFCDVTPASALVCLRALLHLLGVDDADGYGTHDMRRGHAEDLLERGAGLGEILRAGEWRLVGGTPGRVRS